MKLRLRRPRELALALRDLARRRPREAEEYLEEHQEHWGSLAESDPHDAADILEAIDEEAAAGLIAALDTHEAADVLEEMSHEAAADVLEELPSDAAARLLTELPPDEATDIMGHLQPAMRDVVLEKLDDARVDEIQRLMAFPPDSAGGLMKPDPAALPVCLTTGEAIESLRRLHQHLEDLSYVYVVDDGGRLVGVLSFRELIFARPGTALDEVMMPDP